ncbi:hypothetical protein DYE49_11255 [Treponema rectale]|uniref:Ig-like domain (Group 3) n=1 Tax=Treponema rectale TaxID=744512 RepID=A0A840SBH2_9SPIR|nr:hypothetical protein [Treponema rectale]MBB5219107.1 hypothetical protein [Treponema rectale]QOS40991.1 hypothetical protein DYE49_11255 [Treponema rectale]
MKSSIFNIIKKTFFTSLVILVSFSCDVGLGTSVDTETPVISIVTPQVQSVNRENIEVTGTWKDDKSVTSIKISVEDVETKATVIDSVSANVNKDGTWDYVLYTKDSDTDMENVLADGKYKITVNGYDAAGHDSGKITRSFEVDCTPPLFLISKPNSVDAAKPTSFGREVIIAGVLSDDNSVSQMDVEFYDAASGEKINLPKSSFTDFKATNTSITVAKYYNSTEAAALEEESEDWYAYKNYLALYGDSSSSVWNTTKKFKVYPSFTDKAGNKSSVVYLKQNLNKLIKAEVSLEPEPADLKNILNGSYSGSYTSEQIETISEILNGTYETGTSYMVNSDSMLSVSINSNINPTYVVTDCEYTEGKSTSFKSLSLERSLEVQVSSGLSGSKIIPSELKMTICRLNTDLTVDENGTIEVPLSCILDSKGESIENKTEGVSTATYTVSFASLNSILDDSLDIKVGKRYRIEIEGVDEDENTLEAYADNYGFAVTDSTTPSVDSKYYTIADGDLKSAGGNIYVNGTAEVVVYGNYSNTTAGLSELLYTLDGKDYSVEEVWYSADKEISSESDIDSIEWKPFSDFTDRTTTIKSFKIKFTPESDGDFVIVGCNEVYSVSDEDGIAQNLAFTITLDKQGPELTSHSLSDSYEKEESEETVYYVNNISGTFTFTGYADDNVDMDTITLSVTDGLVTSAYNNKNETARNWLFEDIDLSAMNDSAVFTLTLRDVAGNETSESVTVVFDTQAPSGIHYADSENNDIVFRTGSGDNDAAVLAAAKAEDGSALSKKLTWSSSLDADVGTKYCSGVYGNDENVVIRGSFEDSGSGVDIIYYKLFDSEPSAADITNFETDYENLCSGYFHPLTESQVRRVFYTKESASGEVYTTYREVESTFVTTLTTSFTEGQNYLVLVAVDNVGNAAADTMKINYNGETGGNKWNGGDEDDVADENDGNLFFTMNLDTTVPEVTAASRFNETVYTNKQSSLTVYGLAVDSASGVKNVALSVNGNVISSDDDSSTYGSIVLQQTGSVEMDGEQVICSLQKTYWTAEINSSVFSSMSADATINISATVYDRSDEGNSQTVNIAAVAVDTTPPSVAINVPSDADTTQTGIQVNGGLVLSGTAADDNGFDDDGMLTLYYTTTASLGKKSSITSVEGWTESVSCTGGTSWTLPELDTTVITDNSTLYVTAAITDKAGNIGYAAPVALVVSQDSDRPIINFTNISLKSDSSVWLKNTNTLYFVATDDDGITSFYYKDSGAVSWTPVVLSNGAGSFSLADGNHSICFKIIDKDGTSFITDEAGYKSVKLTGESSDSDSEVLDSALEIAVDKTSPVTQDLFYSYFDNDDRQATQDYIDWISTLPALGGARTKLKIKLSAGDENDIESVTANLEKTSSNVISYSGECTESAEYSDVTFKYYSTWEIKDIDVSAAALESGTYNLKLVVTDKAGLSKTDTVQISVDNTGPEVSITSPTSSKTSSGSIIAYGSVSGAQVMHYALSSTDEVEPDGVTKVTSWSGPDDSGTCDASSATAPSYSEIASIGMSWSVYFDGEIDSTTGTHAPLMTDYLEALGITDDVDSFDSPVYMYLWLKAYDEVGNYSSNAFKVLLDPQGDRPSIEITYPESTNAILGDKVKISGIVSDTNGTASDKIGVESVWMQIISTDHGTDTSTVYGSFTYDEDTGVLNSFAITKNDLDYMAANGYSVYNMRTYDSESSTPWVKGSSTIASGYTAADYGALASLSGSAWNITINSNDELNANTSDKNAVAIRMIAKDGDGKCSVNNEDNTYLVYFDSDTPVITGLKLIQKNGSSVAAGRAYSSDMFVKGDWYLTGSVSDSDTIASLKIGSTVTDSVEYINNSSVVTLSADTKTATFEYPLKSSEEANLAGSWNFTVFVTDGASPVSHTGKRTVSINFDNKNPELLSSSNAAFNISEEICQNNSWYTFSSKVTEAAVGSSSQSGFAYTAFYFKRNYIKNSSQVSKLYDVLKARDEAEIDISGTSIPELGEETSASDNVIVTENDLFWYRKNITAESGSQTVTMSDTSNVRVNSLISIGGTYYLVSAVSGTDVTLSDVLPAFSDDEADSYTVAYVAIAAVVDNTVPESDGSEIQSDGYYEKPRYDDGDRMIESVDKSGTTWQWEANICSKNISDGPVEIVYVVFDKAGNHVSDTVSGTVCNYRPRLAGFTLATDYNGDYEMDEELTDYNSESISEAYVTGTVEKNSDTVKVYDPDAVSVTMSKIYPLSTTMTKGSSDSPVMKVRGYTKLMPEIVGGTGAVYYSYSVTNGSKTLSGQNSTPVIASASTDYTINESDAINIQTGDLIAIGNSSEGIPFEFKFWDSAEGTTLFTNEMLSASLTVYLAVNASSSEAPVVEITPFYWNSLTENSVYDSKNASSYSALKGHIELEEDWKNADAYTGTTGEYDGDPKVSGAVTVEGTVHDDNLIKSVAVSINGTSYSVAAFDSSSAALVSSKPASAYASNKYWFEIVSQEFSASGHDVSWKFHWNTESLGTAADVPVTVVASNYGQPSASTGGTLVGIDGVTKYAAALSYSSPLSNTPGTVQTDSEGMTAYYRMDVVPYITKLTTALSSYNTVSSIYDRTALGHYPVYMNFAGGTTAAATATNYNNATYETVKLAGFNLNGGTVNFTAASATTAALTASGSYDSDNGASEYKFTVAAGAKSGNIYVSSSAGIVSLNNENNNDSRGKYGYESAEDGTQTDSVGTVDVQGNYSVYKNYYNRIPNNKNNNNLTDDVFLDIWDINSKAAIAYNKGKVDNLEMKINPDNRMLGFAFSNGTLRFSMANTNTSYQDWNMSWDYMSHNALAMDSNGYSYGVSVGGDINSDSAADQFSFMSSRWGIVGTNSQSLNQGETNHLRLDTIGQKGTKANTGSNVLYRNKSRFKNQSIATHANATNSDNTDVYMAYYDLLNEEIRFKAGTITGGRANYGNFYDIGSAAVNYTNNAARCQIIADGDTTKTLGSAGEYVSVGVTSNNVVVIVWYDGTDLQFAYNANPLDYVNQTAVTYAKNTGWTGLTTPVFSNAGEHCQIAVGGDNSVHIAAYSSSSADLMYAYIPFDEDTGLPDVDNIVTVAVDSYLDIGEYLTIDVAEDADGYQIPYIGYWGTYPEKPRYAYLADPVSFYSGEETAGATQNLYTGVWECTVVPTASTVKDSRKMSVGVWKDSDGVLAYSTTGTNKGKVTGTNSYKSSYATTTAGYCYGNGSDNGVMAYVVAPSSSQYNVETAQKR